MSPRLTIAIPTVNRALLLNRASESALAQSAALVDFRARMPVLSAKIGNPLYGVLTGGTPERG